MPKNNLAFALDYPSLREAQGALAPISQHLGYAKVGLELFTREGPDVVGAVRSLGCEVFLDLKLHDIPATVQRAVANICFLGAKLLTIHTAGGPAMVEQAVQRAEKENTGLTLVGVTVLTSLDQGDLNRIGISSTPSEQTLRLAKMAWSAGLHAFVCSPEEVGALRNALGRSAILITPGIRPAGAALNDQKRVATPAGAIRDGADILVVGRPIRDAANPASMAAQIVREIDEALELRSGPH